MTWLMIEQEVRALSKLARKRAEAQARAKARAEFVGPVYQKPRSGRERLFHLQNGQCWLCGWRMSLDARHKLAFATFDHVKPRFFGGTRAANNVRLAHGLCNSSRGHEPPFCVVPRRDPRIFELEESRDYIAPSVRGPLRDVPFSSSWLKKRGYMESTT